MRYLVGTSGYSYRDWAGTFYPDGARRGEMFDHYVRHFETVELNFTYYRLPQPRTMTTLADKSPPSFLFWVKANRRTTHEQDRQAAQVFLEGLAPLTEAGKLAGVLMQFPQSFHRTAANRRYLAAALEDLSPVPLAVEFRHRSWDHPSVFREMKSRRTILVVPDVPDLGDLFRVKPTATAATGYLRLHSRNAEKWYAGMAGRYDYDYSPRQLRGVLDDWSALAGELERLFVFFNNCHRGQAARNAETLRGLVGRA